MDDSDYYDGEEYDEWSDDIAGLDPAEWSDDIAGFDPGEWSDDIAGFDPAKPFAEALRTWSQLPRNLKPPGHSFFYLRLVFFELEAEVQRKLRSSRPNLKHLHTHVQHLVSDLQRFVRVHNVTVWRGYGLGHVLAGILSHLLPHSQTSKAASRQLNQSLRDLLFTIFEELRSDPELAPTVPKTNMPKVNNPCLPNSLRPSPSGDEQPLSSLEAAPITHTPEDVHGQAATWRAGEVGKSSDLATNLDLAHENSAPSAPNRYKPPVNPSSLRNPSHPSPSGDKEPLSSLETAPITNTPEGVHGQASTGRAGEVFTRTEMATGLALTGPYGTMHLWVPLSWLDWSEFNSEDGDGVDDAVDQAEELDLAEAAVQ